MLNTLRVNYLFPSGGGLKKAKTGWITAINRTIVPMIGWAPASYSNKNIVHFFITEMIVLNKPCERSKILWHSDSFHLLWSCAWGKRNVTVLINSKGCPSAIFEIVREGYENLVRCAWLTFTFYISKTTNWWLCLRRNTSSPSPPRLDTPTIGNRDLNDEKDYEYEIWLSFRVFSKNRLHPGKIHCTFDSPKKLAPLSLWKED